jgi:hypothetical protein
MLSVTASPQCLRAPIRPASDATAKYSTYLRTQLTYDSGMYRDMHQLPQHGPNMAQKLPTDMNIVYYSDNFLATLH